MKNITLNQIHCVNLQVWIPNLNPAETLLRVFKVKKLAHLETVTVPVFCAAAWKMYVKQFEAL